MSTRQALISIHIGGDFLLVYLLNPQKNRVMFSRCGTHADIFA